VYSASNEGGVKAPLSAGGEEQPRDDDDELEFFMSSCGEKIVAAPSPSSAGGGCCSPSPPSDENKSNNRTTTMAGRGKRTEMGVVGGADRKASSTWGAFYSPSCGGRCRRWRGPSLLSRSIPSLRLRKAPFNMSRTRQAHRREKREDKGGREGGALRTFGGPTDGSVGRCNQFWFGWCVSVVRNFLSTTPHTR
jgi:hypothetical protein